MNLVRIRRPRKIAHDGESTLMVPRKLRNGVQVIGLVAMLTALGMMRAASSSPAAICQDAYPVGDKDFVKIALNFLENHCLQCHTGETPEADFDLAPLLKIDSPESHIDVWEQVIQAVDDQYMPPSDRTQPTTEEVRALKGWFTHTLQSAGAFRTTIPRMRRLNQTEYENTVRDLLRMDGEIFANPSQILLVDDYFDPASKTMPRHVLAMSHFSYIQRRPPLLPGVPEVPTDPAVEHGFNNDHTALSFSPLQTERYFELAVAIVHSENFPRLSGVWEPLFLPRPQDQTIEQQIETARRRLKWFLQRAFRRPVSPQEIDRYSNLFIKKLEQTNSHADAMRATVTAILVSPSFLFRQDFSVESFNEHAVDPYAMASRLSYFLWASMPDDQLFQAAREGQLATRAGLIRQVRRMLKDKKVKSLATDFGMQWLKLAGVNSARPDPKLFPEYYYTRVHTPGVAMMIEQLLYFETILVEDRNIMEFVDSDWGFVNRTLMDWYNLEPQKVLGYTPDRTMWEDFFRIQWKDPQRGGVISSGATLISTSATTRTSPVYRGAWLLDVMLNRPPPPPPAAVPALEDTQSLTEKPLNVRQRLERHREDPTCAVCHDRIDPIGFALENFDAIGRIRYKYPNGIRIDAKGTIFGQSFDGIVEFKSVLMRNEREFVQGFTEQMLKYALGRRLELADEFLAQKIVDNVMDRGKNFSVVVEEIVLSDLFRMPPVQTPPPPPADTGFNTEIRSGSKPSFIPNSKPNATWQTAIPNLPVHQLD
jgi:hypothetical protein